MKIVFGTELEGCPVPVERRGLGVAAHGPEGFANLLETALGIAPPAVDGLDRRLAFRQRLEEQVRNQPDAFFAKSFEQDPQATASVLLTWRDELAMGGWNFAVTPEMPPRLAALASMPSEGLPERLARIEAALAGGAETGIEKVELVEKLEAIPFRWRSVLAHLPVQEFKDDAAILADEGTTLNALQRRLAGEHDVAMPTDDSVRIFRAAGVSGLSAGVAELLAEEVRRETSMLIARRDRLATINSALGQRDLPSCPESGVSEYASLPQLALLALRRHWEPFEPQAWLEFFLHPLSPVPGALAGRLARAINEAPGRDNPKWQRAISEARSEAEDGQRIDQAIAAWINPATYPESGAAAEALAETVAALTEWSGGVGAHAGEDQRAAWLSASAALHRLAKLLKQFKQITRLELERLLASWLRTVASGGSSGELGQVKSVRSSGHLLEHHDHVIWWQPETARAPLLPWSAAERTFLQEQGVELLDPAVARAERKRRELEPIRRARKSLTVFVFTQERGRLIPPSSVVTRIIAECGREALRAPEEIARRCSLPVKALPRPRRWLELPKPELLIPRETESYSSLSRYIYSPYQWLFDYAARLRPGRLVDFRIRDDARRQGSLLHGFVESLLEPEAELEADEMTLAFDEDEVMPPATGLLQTLVQRLLSGTDEADWRALDEAAVREWVHEQWPSILAQQAAHYLVRGHEASSNRLQHIATESLWELIVQLREARIVDAHCEVEMESDAFRGGKIKGFVDLLVEREDGAIGVLDLKLGGKTMRKRELFENRHLQLAIYGHLVESERGKRPSCAYFIFKPNGNLLARSKEFFPGATVVVPKRPGPDWSQCWEDFEQVWQWRREQFEQGRIECTIGGTLPDGESRPPIAHWQAPKDADRFNLYSALMGWAD